ncbi:hypothetical protein NG791_24600, partial [Laspinema sp. D1]|uniref:hypothetical protein n=1 Tax=Laspinema palackyanum TaxID=3231601 RepID=UPI0034732A33|nr:hypothetical protein [Laspinema sp. D2b]
GSHERGVHDAYSQILVSSLIEMLLPWVIILPILNKGFSKNVSSKDEKGNFLLFRCSSPSSD